MHGQFGDQLQQLVVIFSGRAVLGIVGDLHGLDDGLFTERKGKKLDVPKAIFFLFHKVHSLTQRQGPGVLLEPVSGGMAKGNVGDNPQGADTAAGGEEAVAITVVQRQAVAIGQHQAKALHLPGQAGESGAGTVGTGGNGAGQRLQVDVGLIEKTVPQAVRLGAGHGQPGAAAPGKAFAVLLAQSGHGFQRNQGIVGGYHGAERMAATKCTQACVTGGDRVA